MVHSSQGDKPRLPTTRSCRFLELKSSKSVCQHLEELRKFRYLSRKLCFYLEGDDEEVGFLVNKQFFIQLELQMSCREEGTCV